MSTNKTNDKACTELAEVHSEVVKNKVLQFISEHASKARKTSKEKELVFLKILADGFKGVIPNKFALKCQRMKDFGGGTLKAHQCHD